MGQSKIWQGLRPLLWWLLLVLVLLGIYTHERLIQQTRLYFSTSTVPYSITTTLDGKPVWNGDRISLGKHHFEISGPQIDPFTLDFTAWYGRHDLGNVPLKRSLGTLVINANPPAQTITIQGSEFSTNLQNSSGGSFAVPTDDYTVDVQYRHWSDSKSVKVVRDASAPISFVQQFGSAILETKPSGASVYGDRDNYLGATPLLLSEIPIQTLRCRLELTSYQPVLASLDVVANQTNAFRTNLVSLAYISAMDDARRFMAQSNYLEAGRSALQAVAAAPNDPAAIALQRQLAVRLDIQRARTYGSNGNYTEGIKLLEAALRMESNEEAKALLADYRQREPGQLKRDNELARLNAPKQAFDAALSRYNGANLFKAQKFTTTKQAQDIGIPLNNALTNMAWIVTYFNQVTPDILMVEARRSYFGGMRRCLIIVGQVKDGETEIWGEVMEYESVHNISLQGLMPKDDVQYKPMQPLDQNDAFRRRRIEDGVKEATEAIQRVLGT